VRAKIEISGTVIIKVPNTMSNGRAASPGAGTGMRLAMKLNTQNTAFRITAPSAEAAT
jgi:hypothetical protein